MNTRLSHIARMLVFMLSCCHGTAHDEMHKRNEARSVLKWLWNCIDMRGYGEGWPPNSLDEVIGVCVDSPFDPWGQRYSYNRLSSSFELYSNGPDGVPMTGDDIFATRHWGICLLAWVGGEWVYERTMRPMSVSDQTAFHLAEIAGGITARYEVYNEYPSSLDGMDKGLFSRFERETLLEDPWGHRYYYSTYSVLDMGYELFSSGPDAIPYSEDDILPVVEPDRCPL